MLEQHPVPSPIKVLLCTLAKVVQCAACQCNRSSLCKLVAVVVDADVPPAVQLTKGIFNEAACNNNSKVQCLLSAVIAFDHACIKRKC